jgi:hypothetical protein
LKARKSKGFENRRRWDREGSWLILGGLNRKGRGKFRGQLQVNGIRDLETEGRASILLRKTDESGI